MNDLYRREGKSRRCCVEDRMYSIPYRASYFALGRFEEQDELHQDYLKTRMSSSYSSNRSTVGQNRYVARQGIEGILSHKQRRRPLPSLLYQPFFYYTIYIIQPLVQYLPTFVLKMFQQNNPLKNRIFY